MLGTSVFAGLAWLLQTATFAGNPPQLQPTPTVRAAEACRASLTELGRAATFSGTAIFEAVRPMAVQRSGQISRGFQCRHDRRSTQGLVDFGHLGRQ